MPGGRGITGVSSRTSAPSGSISPSSSRRKTLKITHVPLSREEIIETGEFSLEGLLIHLEQGIAEVGAKRIVLDTMESVFSGLSSTGILRREIARLFQWLREKGLTTVITGERGNRNLTRHGLEEYVSDCVLLLDHRVIEQISKKRLRIVKYGGSAHGADEYPFLIRSMLPRCLDHLKSRGVTFLSTALRLGSGRADETQADVSFMTDTWIAVELDFLDGAGHREIHVIKPRGMKHSLRTLELVMSSNGG